MKYMNELKSLKLNDRRCVDHRVQEYKNVRDSHQEIIRLILLGFNNIQIAEACNVTPQTVSNVRNNPIHRSIINTGHEDAFKEAVSITTRINEMLPKALDVLEELLENGGERTKQTTAFGLLDRGGFGPSKNVNVSNGILSDDELRLSIIKRGKEMAKAAGMIVDVECETVEDDEDEDRTENIYDC